MPTKDEIAQKLIDWHFEVEPEITEVYRFIAPDEDNVLEPIKLLEVTEATMTVGSVMPFGFGATEEIPYRSIVATITPEEMQQIKSLEIPLPSGWDLETAKVIAAPMKAGTRNGAG